MATTTTNFGWDIPQSTDLVKDGATAIATLGQDIDTALVDLKGGTTGQLLSKASGTDLDYTWTTVSSGSLTLLSTTTLSGATTTISIGTGYKALYITVEKANTTSNDQYWFRFNSDSGSNYKYVGYEQNGTTDQLVGSGGYATFVRLGYTPSSSNTISQQIINIPNYLTDTWKLGNYTIANLDGSSPNRPTLEQQSFSYNSATAISSITFGCMYYSFNAGTVKIYGVN